jgi:hypothetical protein
MTWELVAVEGLTLAHGSLSTISLGAFEITTPADLFSSVDGAGMYFGELGFAFTGGSAPGFVVGSVAGAGVIAPSGVTVLSGGSAVCREGDTGTLAAAGTLLIGGPGTVSGPVVISVAGQLTVRVTND